MKSKIYYNRFTYDSRGGNSCPFVFVKLHVRQFLQMKTNWVEWNFTFTSVSFLLSAQMSFFMFPTRKNSLTGDIFLACVEDEGSISYELWSLCRCLSWVGLINVQYDSRFVNKFSKQTWNDGKPLVVCGCRFDTKWLVHKFRNIRTSVPQ